jgi:hypothetical protein
LEFSLVDPLATFMAGIASEPEDVYRLCSAIGVKYNVSYDAMLCAELVRDRDEADVLLRAAGLEPSNFSLDGAASVFWTNILVRSTQLQGGFLGLMAAIRGRFQNRVDLRRDPIARWQMVLRSARNDSSERTFTGIVDYVTHARPELLESLQKALIDNLVARSPTGVQEQSPPADVMATRPGMSRPARAGSVHAWARGAAPKPGPARINGTQRGALRAALIQEFPNRSDLEMLLDDTLSVALDSIVPDSKNLTETAFELIKWASIDPMGRLQPLLNAAVEQRPHSTTLRELKSEVFGD